MSSIDESALQELIQLMHIPPHKRSVRDLQTITNLTKGVQFFADHDPAMHEACCHLMKYAEYERGDYIFKKGSQGDSFCIILKGSVGVLVPNPRLFVANPVPVHKQHSGRDSVGITLVKRLPVYAKNLFGLSMMKRSGGVFKENLPHSQVPAPPAQEEEEQIEVSELGAGASFGELSLLEDLPRSASVLCKEHTVLAVLSKESFNLVLKEYEIKKLNEKINFIRSIPAFHGWSRQALSKLTIHLKERKYKRSNVVFHEGDTASEVFIVLEGEFKLTKICKLRKKEARENSIAKSVSTLSQLQLVIKGPREIFGDQEALSDLPRSTTCTCMSTTGRLWAIAKPDFTRHLNSTETWNILFRKQQVQTQWMTKRLDRLLGIEEMKIRPDREQRKSLSQLPVSDFGSLKLKLKSFSNTVLDAANFSKAKNNTDRPGIPGSLRAGKSISLGGEPMQGNKSITSGGLNKVALYMKKGSNG